MEETSRSDLEKAIFQKTGIVVGGKLKSEKRSSGLEKDYFAVLEVHLKVSGGGRKPKKTTIRVPILQECYELIEVLNGGAENLSEHEYLAVGGSFGITNLGRIMNYVDPEDLEGFEDYFGSDSAENEEQMDLFSEE